jgi:hypothetical protein
MCYLGVRIRAFPRTSYERRFPRVLRSERGSQTRRDREQSVSRHDSLTVYETEFDVAPTRGGNQLPARAGAKRR